MTDHPLEVGTYSLCLGRFTLDRDLMLFVQLYELTSGECVLDSPEKNYTIDLPSSFDPADVRSVMVPRCVNEDCSETEFVEAP